MKSRRNLYVYLILFLPVIGAVLWLVAPDKYWGAHEAVKVLVVPADHHQSEHSHSAHKHADVPKSEPKSEEKLVQNFQPAKPKPKYDEEHEPLYEHVHEIEQENIFAKVVALPTFNDDEREQVGTWLTNKGYHLVLGGCKTLDREEDFCEMPEDYMLALAQNGDPDAQFLLGLKHRWLYEANPTQEGLEQAQDWLLDAVINGGYTAAFNQLSTLHFNQIAQTYEIYSQSPDEVKVDQEFTQKLKQARAWAHASSLMGDYLGMNLSDSIGFSELSKLEQEEIEQIAENFINNINQQRRAKNRLDLRSQSLPEDLSQRLPL